MEIKSLEGPSVFVDVMGDTPVIRILDFLLGEIGHDFILKELAEKSGVGYATIKRIWDRFVRNELVKSTRKVGKAIFYTYNEESFVGKALRKFYLDILFQEAEAEAKMQTVIPAQVIQV